MADEGAASNTHAAGQLSPHAFGFRAPINDLMVDACANDESDERATRAQGQTRAARVGGDRGGTRLWHSLWPFTVARAPAHRTRAA